MTRTLVLVKEKLVDIGSERGIPRGRFAAVSSNGFAYTATSNGAIVQTHLSKEGFNVKEVLYRIHEVRGQPAESSFRILRPFTTFQLAARPGGDGAENFVFTFAGQRRIMIAQVPQGVLNVTYVVHLLGSHQAPVTSTAVENEEGLFASSSEDGCLKVWDLERGEEIASTARATEGGATSLGFAFRHHVLSGAKDGTVCLWAVDSVASSLVRLQRLQIPIGFMPVSGVSACMILEKARGAAVEAGEKFMSRLWIAAGAEDGSFYVWSANGPEEKWELVKSNQYVRSAPVDCLHFDPVHNTLLVSGWAGLKTPALHVYSIPSFECIARWGIKSPALALRPRTRLTMTACLESLVVETLAVPRVDPEGADASVEASPEPSLASESPAGGSAESPESKSAGEAEADVAGEKAAAIGPAPRKMPQEIQDLIDKLKSKPAPTAALGSAQPQPREVPKIVIKEVCSTSGEGASTEASAAPKQRRTQGDTGTGEPLGEAPKRKVAKGKKKKKKRREKRVEYTVESTDELARPRLCSTAMLRDEIESLQRSSFNPSKAVVEQCREKAVVKAMATSNATEPQKISARYKGLAPIVDKVPGKKVRKVGKQVDPSWAESIKVEPKMEDCWRPRERVPQICELEVTSVPSYGALVDVHSRIAMF